MECNINDLSGGEADPGCVRRARGDAAVLGLVGPPDETRAREEAQRPLCARKKRQGARAGGALLDETQLTVRVGQHEEIEYPEDRGRECARCDVVSEGQIRGHRGVERNACDWKEHGFASEGRLAHERDESQGGR